MTPPTKTKYICLKCGAEGRVRWSSSHDDMIVECSNVRCGSFIQMFIGYTCNIHAILAGDKS